MLKKRTSLPNISITYVTSTLQNKANFFTLQKRNHALYSPVQSCLPHTHVWRHNSCINEYRIWKGSTNNRSLSTSRQLVEQVSCRTKTITMGAHTSHTALFAQAVCTLHFCLHSHWFSATYTVHISLLFICTTICTLHFWLHSLHYLHNLVHTGAAHVHTTTT